jgi:hypothetical protein
MGVIRSGKYALRRPVKGPGPGGRRSIWLLSSIIIIVLSLQIYNIFLIPCTVTEKISCTVTEFEKIINFAIEKEPI